MRAMEADAGDCRFLTRMVTVADKQLDKQKYFQWSYEDFDMCADANIVKTHMQWQACNNNAMYNGKSLGTLDASTGQYSNVVGGAFNIGSGSNTATNAGYSQPHWIHTQVAFYWHLCMHGCVASSRVASVEKLCAGACQSRQL